MGKLARAQAPAIDAAVGALLVVSSAAFGQAAGVSDLGPRGTPIGAGQAALASPLSFLLPGEKAFFSAAQTVFQEVDSVSGGLGPRFNGNSCAQCHIQPVVGGSSPADNPLLVFANQDNSVPSFITAKGPIREARFVKNSNGTPDGGVHDIFVITGRGDAQGCNIRQPDFAQATAQNNIIFRIPTPILGAGLVENTPDGNLKTDSLNISGPQASLGISSGVFNVSGNDGTITRFGWKAQNKSLLIFAGEAYNVEQGVTNELFPNERDDTQGCIFNATPEDATHSLIQNASSSAASDISSDVTNFAVFMRFSAAPTPATPTNQTTQGRNQFVNIGCGGCHIPNHMTANTAFGGGQGPIQLSPFSDFALHNMGTGLQDRVSQGAANGQQFRTAPLWGVGQRLFFLHDGRTSDLVAAVEAHASSGSEANQVIGNFNRLSASDQQAVIAFLRSL